MAEHNPDVIRRIDEAGHEIGNHGYTHERFVEKTVEEQLEILKKTQKIIKDITGKEPKGFRTPSGDWHVRTPYLLNELGFLYSSSMRGDDIPYYTVLDGKETDLVEIPGPNGNWTIMWLRPTVFIRQNRLVWIESVVIGMYRT